MSATNKLDTDMSTRCDGCRELTTRVLKLEVDVDLLTEIIASLLKFDKIKPPEHDTKDMKNINEPDLMNLKKPVKGYRRRAQRNKRQRTKSLDKSSDSTEMDGNKGDLGPPLSESADLRKTCGVRSINLRRQPNHRWQNRKSGSQVSSVFNPQHQHPVLSNRPMLSTSILSTDRPRQTSLELMQRQHGKFTCCLCKRFHRHLRAKCTASASAVAATTTSTTTTATAITSTGDHTPHVLPPPPTSSATTSINFDTHLATSTTFIIPITSEDNSDAPPITTAHFPPVIWTRLRPLLIAIAPLTHASMWRIKLLFQHPLLLIDIASLQEQAISPTFQNQPKLPTPHFQSVHPSCSNTVATCWYHISFGTKVRRCISSCSFISKQSKRVRRVSPKVSAANGHGSSNHSCTFYVRDIRSGGRFLVDTGEQLSVIPPTPADRRCPNPGLIFQAVNASPITTFGTYSLSLDIGCRRLFSWVFVVADICAILGIDFLVTFDLLVDCRQSHLPDQTTNLTVRGISSSYASRQLAVLNPEPENPFRQLLVKYPSLTRPKSSASTPPHDVVYHIRTIRPPAFPRPRRLRPARLSAAKAEFVHVSPFHMVPKVATGDWSPYGDFRALKNVTVPDRYPVPHLKDFAGAPFGKLRFSKADLVCAFHRIRIVPEDVLKTAVTIPFGLFEFLAVLIVVKHFRHFLEGRDFAVFTDHKPLSFALKSTSDKLNLWEIRPSCFNDKKSK
ncbi:hypothetical protein SprV_0301222700 [Sparganum proliferum]